MENKKLIIEVCMGSSCYSRGNRANVAFLQGYLKKNGLEDRVELVGKLCAGRCKTGPTILFDGESRGKVTPEALPDLLSHYLKAR